MKNYCLIIFTIFFSLVSCFTLGKSLKKPITVPLSVQSPIASGKVGLLTLPSDWTIAHVQCNVTNLLSDDRFIIHTQMEPSGMPEANNLLVDKNSMPGNYFELSNAGTHVIEFDINCSDCSTPLPSNINFYNVSTEPLNFYNCTAASE